VLRALHGWTKDSTTPAVRKYSPDSLSCHRRVKRNISRSLSFGSVFHRLSGWCCLLLGLSLSLPFLLATLLVYIVLPELRNLHGKTFMSYVGSMAAAYVDLIFVQLDCLPSSFCPYLGKSQLSLQEFTPCVSCPRPAILIFRVLLLTRHAFTMRDFNARRMTRTQF